MSQTVQSYLVVCLRPSWLESAPYLTGVFSSFEESHPRQNGQFTSLCRRLPVLAFGHLSIFFQATLSTTFFNDFSVLSARCLALPPTLLPILLAILLGQILLGYGPFMTVKTILCRC